VTNGKQWPRGLLLPRWKFRNEEIKWNLSRREVSQVLAIALLPLAGIIVHAMLASPTSGVFVWIAFYATFGS